MTRYMLVVALLGVLPIVSASGYEEEYRTESNESVVVHPMKTYKKKSTVRKTGGYNNTITNNFYYNSQPAEQVTVSKRSQMYRDYDNADVKKSRYVEETKRSYSSQERKYFLAHPFFQPLQGKLGSVTDLSYARNGFKFDILNGTITDYDSLSPTAGYSQFYASNSLSGKAEQSQSVVKEDLIFGLSDTLALMVMAQYDSTKTKFKDWTGGLPSDEDTSSGLNLFGIGLQNRFIDTDEWIAMFSGYFQHQKNTANSFIFDAKAGYKINRTTVYGLARIGYSNLIHNDVYGAVVTNPSGEYKVLTYKTDVKDVFYIEGGAGVFSVLNKYWYVGGELLCGRYDWHNQLNIQGTIGVQPTEHFALSLYASTSLYDSAKGKTRTYMQYDIDPELPADLGSLAGTTGKEFFTTGDYKINSYNEWKVGVQAILYF